MAACIRLGSIALFLLSGACGGGSDGGSSAFTGTVHGQSITVKDTISASVTTMSDGFTIHAAAIVMASASDLCGDAIANSVHPNEKGVLIVLTDINGTTATTPTAAGTYAVYQGSGAPPAKAAFFTVSVTDATCQSVSAQSAAGASGTVTLSAVSGNRFSGSFDIALDSGDHVTGSFAPGECPELNARLNSSTAPSCI